MLIVLEGLDGAGKSTQISLLKKYFISAGKDVEFLHYPRFDAPVYGDLISRFLRGEFGPIESVHPMLVALLFAEDRRDSLCDVKKWIESGSVVILDRYVYSNIAFQCAKLSDTSKKEELRNWILETEFVRFNLPEPDFNFFLDVPLDFVETKLSEARSGDERAYLKGEKDIHEQDISFQRSVRDMYTDECKRGHSLIRVECYSTQGRILTSAEIHNKLTSLINL